MSYIKPLAILLPLFVTGCSTKQLSDESLQGVWMDEKDGDIWAGFKFLGNNRCGFSGGSRSARDATGSACTYRIDENIIYIQFVDPSERPNVGEVVQLEYDQNSRCLIMKVNGSSFCKK